MKDWEVIHAIEGKRRFGSLAGVLSGKELLAAAENPQKDLAFVHIAGTNGKGSAAAFLSAILKESGIKSGLFTSPHLVDFTERIRVDGEQIPRNRAAEIGRRLLNLRLGIQPAMFDYCLAMALLYFKEQGCRLAVLETGLGGRLDSTNAAGVPLVSIITKIGYDHMAVLGETLEEIAAEKAGILKRGTRAVLESQRPEVMKVLLEACKNLKIPCKVLQKENISAAGGGFFYPGETLYHMRMLGEFQQENALAAILCARELMALGFPVTEEAMHRGIAGAVWPGRMEVLCREPYLIIDGAHNEDGAAAFADSLKKMHPGERFHFIMGVMADKDYKKMAAQILPLAEKVTAVTPGHERALQGEALASYIRTMGVCAEWEADLPKAFAPFLEKKPASGGRTAAFGSLYFIGEIKKMFW